MIEAFKKAASDIRRNKYLKVWQDGYHPEMIYSNKFFFQKLNYIHMNPVKAGIVELPEDYYYSSARNYAELSAPLEIIIQSIELETL
jgi:REP element-mobilizing transposase RayT